MCDRVHTTAYIRNKHEKENTMENVQKEFGQWLDANLETAPLSELTAINFNLYEADEEQLFHVQVVGTASFDEEDEDWACDEVFSSGEDIFFLRAEDWEVCLESCAELVRHYLDEGKFADTLKAMRAVAMGFVDGDLEIIYENDSRAESR